MTNILDLPTPPLPAPLAALQAAAARQEPGSGFSANLRPLRARRTLAAHSPNPLLVPPPAPQHPNPNQQSPTTTSTTTAANNDDDTPSPPANETMLQAFEWYVPADGAHWRRLEGVLPALAAGGPGGGGLGVTKLWIPPACRAASPRGNGYDVYDLWDLGEFGPGPGPGSGPGSGSGHAGSGRADGVGVRDGKGACAAAGVAGTSTKWGTKEELVRMARVAKGLGVGVLFDAVLNHKAGADFVEAVPARRVDGTDRRKVVDREAVVIEAATGFAFPARKGRHSAMAWNKQHFTGVDYDHRSGEQAVWKLEGKEWAEDVDEELGNYDFLLFADIDHKHPEVRADMLDWVRWLPTQLHLGGLRLDAVKHYSFAFVRDLVRHAKTSVAPDWFIVAEYWREDSEFLAKYIEFMDHQISLFDVQLVTNFSRVSMSDGNEDLSKVLDDCLALWKPDNAVTFVVNHDTQAGQSLEVGVFLSIANAIAYTFQNPVAPFFIPLAYALILLRANLGLPCVFYADLFGYAGQHAAEPGSADADPSMPPGVLPRLMLARRLWAYGSQYDYFDAPRCVGFTRLGHPAHSGGNGLAVVMTDAWEAAAKRMFVGARHAGEVWTDLLGCPGRVVIDTDGWGVFPVGQRSVAVWVNAVAAGRDVVDSFVFDYDIYGLRTYQSNGAQYKAA